MWWLGKGVVVVKESVFVGKGRLKEEGLSRLVKNTGREGEEAGPR
jgi:hypothetical protein